jgi:tetratricopeptide (TPR) repeat protein
MFEWLKSLLNMPGAVHRGVDYIDEGEYSKGYDILKPLVDKEKKSDLLYQSFARALSGLKKNREALEYAEKACELKPHNPANHGVLASIYIELSDYENALSAIDSGLRADSKNAYLHFLKGLVYLKTEKPDLAIEHFEEFMAFNHSISIARIFTMCETILQEIKSHEFDSSEMPSGNQNKSKEKSGSDKSAEQDDPIKKSLGRSLFAHYEKGLEYLSNSRLDEATMEFEKICRKRQSFVMARMLIFTEMFFYEKYKDAGGSVFFKKENK